MNMKKRLLGAFGPFLLAALIASLIMAIPVKNYKVPDRIVHRASTSMAINILKGNLVKNKAMSDPRYVPFFGSSELSRVNAFHPAVLAEKYHRNYRPFLLGAPGTQSLSHFFMLQSMGKKVKGKKAVFIISPQWFVETGVRKEMFDVFFSPLQTYQWLLSLDKVEASDQYLAKRLLKFQNVRSDTFLKTLLKQVLKDQLPTENQRKECHMKLYLFAKEDLLFSKFGLNNRLPLIKKEERLLPRQYDFEALDQLAYRMGKKSTNNNPYEISNKFYRDRIAAVEKGLKNSQTDFDYRYSPEFSDFEMVLSEIARLKMDVLFVIPPVNEHWSDYTGLSQEMLKEFNVKIVHQLTSQGFTHIANFYDEKSTPYFMEDTIHLGWRGWLAMDQYVAPFLKDRKAEPVNYKIDDYYFTRDWQLREPESISDN